MSEDSLNFSMEQSRTSSFKQTTIVGIDPGASGGIAWGDLGGVHVEKMPETRGDTIKLLKQICGGENNPVIAYIEKISGWIPDGGASMMFTFGQNVERVGCILEVLGARIIEVRPQEWQRGLHLPQVQRQRVPQAPRGATKEQKQAFKLAMKERIAEIKRLNAKAKSEHKSNLKSEAQRRFPSLDVTLKTCDALLLLDYAVKEERIRINGF